MLPAQISEELLPLPEFPGSSCQGALWDNCSTDRHVMVLYTAAHMLTYVLHHTHIKGKVNANV